MDKPSIFISHIAEEKEIAIALKVFLEKRFQNTINVFASSDEDSIKLGDNWIETIRQSLQNCKLLIVICSPISIGKTWISFEAGAGWIREIPVIPLCHSGLTPGKLPVPINSFQGGLINSQDDIRKLFKRIAGLNNSIVPETDDLEFYDAIQNFETQIKNSLLSKDTTFIYNLLFRQIDVLKYSIFASTVDYDELQKVDLNNFKDHRYTFNDTYNLFNSSLIMYDINEKVFQRYYKTVHQLADNIKFVLTYSNINISPKICELFNMFLFSVIKVDEWYNGIFIQDKQTENGLRDLAIKMIKEEPLPPTRRYSNIINLFIDYHDSLEFYQAWLIEYEKEINDILRAGNNL